ncbi:nitrogen permease regulator 2 [Diplogelasinospora grovesii]|uniref:Nitrogen permease regulator 2 n=1 Tax=Diplogelasinospora grovesii TaxID=303347 RepID=A0AAN6S5X3_9PEZI|nr:nitrogen permease regulator 2 [Diplogelasinospora grovesii]
MIQGIFYARFFPQQGTKIVAQSPPGCIVPVPGSKKSPLFNFGVMQEYIIPRKAFYNRYITVRDPDGKYSVLGFPVSIVNPKYDRNEFIFNFGLVVEADAGIDQIPYERVVRRLATTFAEMERQDGYLSLDARNHIDVGSNITTTTSWDDGKRGGYGGYGGGGFEWYRRPIESLLEIIKEDLNNYGECMIPVDDANTINMKLFPHHPPPLPVKGWHVPVAKMKFSEIVDPTWDLTLQKVIAHIDGVSDVRRIAWQADVSIELTKLALQHLLYYDTILLLDLFLFGACYAPRPAIHDFIANIGGIVDECANYVCLSSGITEQDLSRTSSGGSLSSMMLAQHGVGRRVSNYTLIKLMSTFCAAKTVREWIKLHMDAGLDVLRFVDVRRLVQFGVIKGLLYRVHKYVVSKQYLASLVTGQSGGGKGGGGGGGVDPLQRYTDGCHTFDQIMTEQNMTDAEIMDKLKSFPAPAGDLTVLYA